MIITENLKKNFFDEIIGKQLLMIVANGADSVCSFKIIKHILRNYGSSFSYDVIKGKNELTTSFAKYGEVDNVLLINFGAMIDIVEFLGINHDSKTTIYVLDSQRPIHINNFYNNKQVKLLTFEESFDNVPDFDDVFRDEEDEDESEDEEGAPTRTRLSEAHLENIIRKREWSKRREDFLAVYEDYIYHGTSSSLVAFEIAVSVNQFNHELLWTATIGHTSQYVLNFISRNAYCERLQSIKMNLARVTLARTYARKRNREEIFMEEKEDLNLWLYRHWSLDEALHITPVTLSSFKLCRKREFSSLNEFLAILGIPQQNCKDQFSNMNATFKAQIFTLFKENCERFNLSKEDLFLPTFTANCGYRTTLSAIDATFIIVAILEDPKSKDDNTDRFNKACNVISVWNNSEIEYGLKLAKDLLKSVHEQTKDLLLSNDVLVYGSFLHIELKQSAPVMLRSTLVQYLLTRYILNASYSIRPKLGVAKKAERSPLILCSTVGDNQLTLYGIPPLASDPGKNLFGRVFETVLTNMNYQLEQDSLDVCRVTINISDKMRVFDRISRLLMS